VITLRLNRSSKDSERLPRLLDFAKEVVGICDDLGIEPVLSGSLAVLAYTQNENITVNDIDLSCEEKYFGEIIRRLDSEGIAYLLKEWHVLQVWREDLKVEFDAQEYWLGDMPEERELLCVEDLQVTMVGLDYLRELYQRGLDDTAAQDDENSQEKHAALKVKYDALSEYVGPQVKRLGSDTISSRLNTASSQEHINQ
jgi:hypothetical protein